MKESNLVSLLDASKWASSFINKNVTINNIAYLLQYAKVKRFDVNGCPMVSIAELKEYYEKIH